MRRRCPSRSTSSPSISVPKVALVSLDGEVVASEKEPVGLRVLPGGGVEQSPAEWWRAVVAAARRVGERAPAARDSVAAVALTGQWAGTVAVDEAGEPLMGAVIWLDSAVRPTCAGWPGAAAGGRVRARQAAPLAAPFRRRAQPAGATARPHPLPEAGAAGGVSRGGDLPRAGRLARPATQRPARHLGCDGDAALAHRHPRPGSGRLRPAVGRSPAWTPPSCPNCSRPGACSGPSSRPPRRSWASRRTRRSWPASRTRCLPRSARGRPSTRPTCTWGPRRGSPATCPTSAPTRCTRWRRCRRRSPTGIWSRASRRPQAPAWTGCATSCCPARVTTASSS